MFDGLDYDWDLVDIEIVNKTIPEIEIVDGSGNVATGSIIIEVPHNVGSVTINDGAASILFSTEITTKKEYIK